jgi:hypothetical protein
MERRDVLKALAIAPIAAHEILNASWAAAAPHRSRILVLYQAPSLTALRNNRAHLRRLVQLPGVNGFSVRVPGNVLNPRPGVWDMQTFRLAREIAGSKELQTRTMGGRWAPRHARGNTLYWPGGSLAGEQIQLPRGTPIPMCFNTSRRARPRVLRLVHPGLSAPRRVRTRCERACAALLLARSHVGGDRGRR